MMRIASIVALAVATHVSLDIAGLTPTQATSGQTPRGEILYQSDREGPTRIFLRDVASGAERRLGAPGDWRDEEPVWSRDGKRIAFGSTRGGDRNLDIWVMDADGSNLIRLTDHPAPEMGPAWAHDDKSIFFTGERDGHNQIYRVRLDDKRVEQITRGPHKAMMAAASPDGRYLSYAVQMATFQLFLLDFTTGATRQITTGAGACRPSFGPDSQEIAFVRLREKESSHLEAVREEGPRVIHKDPRLWSYYPDYSPDGRYVVFSVSPEHHQGEDWDLALLDLQQPGKFTRLTSGPGNDRVPRWRPVIR